MGKTRFKNQNSGFHLDMCKTAAFLLLGAVFFAACAEPGEIPPRASASVQVVESFRASSSPTPTQPFIMDENAPDYREAMRQWVMNISRETRKVDSNFIIIPQNSSPLLTMSGRTDGQPAGAFIAAIDGLGQESLCFGTGGYGIPRSEKSREEIAERLGLAREYSLSVLSIDYCSRAGQMVFAAQYNLENGFLGFFAPNFELTQIPDMTAQSNSRDIMRLSEAENFLVLLNPAQYTDKQDYIRALSQTDYDVLVIDADFDGKTVLTYADINQLKNKASGGTRLVIAYLSIGEAEEYRSYWQESWNENPPEWLLHENRRWDGNYIVKYWHPDWQEIVLYSEDSEIHKILSAGFDGVYLDIVDGYEYFEDLAGY